MKNIVFRIGDIVNITDFRLESEGYSIINKSSFHYNNVFEIVDKVDYEYYITTEVSDPENYVNIDKTIWDYDDVYNIKNIENGKFEYYHKRFLKHDKLRMRSIKLKRLIMNNEILIDYTDFVDRQFQEEFKGTNLSGYDKDVLLSKIRKESDKLIFIDSDNYIALSEGKAVKLIEGYAPFCRLLFIPNPTNVKTGTVPITMSNERFLQSDYISRRDDEKAVLTRFLNIPSFLSHEIPKAKYLMVILYSKKQIDSENLKFWKESGSVGKKPDLFYCDYGIISINAQMVDFEEPMNPITMMRNALGESYGGSGVSIDESEYEKSVEFWKKNAIVFG